MKVVTLSDKDQKKLIKLIDKKMKSMHGKFELKEKDLTEQQTIKHHKTMAKLSVLRDAIR